MPRMHNVLTIHKLDVVVCACNSSNGETGVRGSEAQCYPQLHEASQGYVKLNKKEEKIMGKEKEEGEKGKT